MAKDDDPYGPVEYYFEDAKKKEDDEYGEVEIRFEDTPAPSDKPDDDPYGAVEYFFEDEVDKPSPQFDYTPSETAKQYGGDDREAQMRVDRVLMDLQSGAMPEESDEDAIPAIISILQSDKPVNDALFEYAANPGQVEVNTETIAKAKQRAIERKSQEYAMASSGQEFRPRVTPVKRVTYQDAAAMVDKALVEEGQVPAQFDRNSDKFDQKAYDKLVQEQYNKMAAFPVPAQTVAGETVGQYTTIFPGLSPEATYELQKSRGEIQPETAEEFAAGPPKDTSPTFAATKALTTSLMTSRPDEQRKPEQMSSLKNVATLEAMVSMLEQAEKGNKVVGSPGKILNAATSYGDNAPESIKKFDEKRFEDVIDPEGTVSRQPIKPDFEVGQFAENVQRQLVETVGIIPAIGYYGYYNIKNDRSFSDVADDITTFAPAVVEYMYEELQDPSRFAYNYPLDALGIVALGSGAAKAALGKTAAVSGKLGATTLAKGFQMSSNAFDLAYRAANPIEAGKMIAGAPIRKGFEIAQRGYIEGPGGSKFIEISPKVNDFFTRSYLAFMDPSELGGAHLVRPDGKSVTMHDLFSQKEGAIATDMNNAKIAIEDAGASKMSAETVDAMRDMLYGELQSGSKLYIETPQSAAAYTNKKVPLVRASAQTLAKLDEKAAVLDSALAEADKLREILPKRKLTADELTDRPDLSPDDVVVDKSIDSPELADYNTKQAAAEDALLDYQKTFDDAFAEHIDATPQEFYRRSGASEVGYTTQSEFFNKPGSRFQVDIVDGGAVRDVKYFPGETYNKFRYADFTRKQVDEAIATGGASSTKTFGELVRKFRLGEKIGFVADDIISRAHTIRMFDELDTAAKIAEADGKPLAADKLDKLRELRRESGVDNLTAVESNFLRWVGNTFDAPAMKEAVGVYSTKMPDGSIGIVEQLGSAELHASQMRTRLLQLGARSVELGLLNQDTFMKRLSEYFPHFYILQKRMEKMVNDIDAGIKTLRTKKKSARTSAEKNRIEAEIQQQLAERQEVLREAAATRDEFGGGPPVRNKHFKQEKLRGLSFEEKLDRGLEANPFKAGLQGIINLSEAVESATFLDSLYSTAKNADGTVAKNADGTPVITGMRYPDSGPYANLPFAANKPLRPGWRQMPDSPKFRDLAGKYVSPESHYYLTESFKWGENGGQFMQWFNSATTKWKALATLYNLPTHIRNVMSNFAFATLYAGNPFLPGNKSARQAWGLNARGLLTKDNIFRQAWRMRGKDVEAAIADRALGTDFTSAELAKLDKLWKVAESELSQFGKNGEIIGQFSIANAVMEAGKRVMGSGYNPINFLRKLYQFEENVFKLARYKQVKVLHKEFAKTGKLTGEMRQVFGGKENALKALNVADEEIGRIAAKEANTLFFDYSDTSKIVNMARKTTSPFITFQYKAIPLMAKWMHQNPARAFMYRRAFETINFAIEYGNNKDLSRDEIFSRELERRALPDYLRATGMRLPIEEERKFSGIGEVPASQYADVQYMTPAGGVVQRASGYEGGLFPATFSMLQFSHPFYTAAANAYYNKDSFTNREIWNDSMSGLEVASAIVENALLTAGGPQVRTYQAFHETADQLPIRGYEGAVIPDWTEFIGDKVFGFKKRVVMQGEYSKLYDAYQRRENKLKQAMKRSLKDAELTGKSDEEYDELYQNFMIKLQGNERQLENDLLKVSERTRKVMRTKNR